MGWCNYIADTTAKVILEAGKVCEDDFFEEAKNWEYGETINTWDLAEKKLKDITIGDWKQILKCIDFTEKHLEPMSRILALTYYNCFKDEREFKFVYEDKLDEYKGYFYLNYGKSMEKVDEEIT